MTEFDRRDQDDRAIRKLSMDARVEARMLDEKTPVTDAQRASLLDDLRALKARRNWSDRELANGIGKSTSVISQMFSGTYGGDVDGVLRQIDQFLAKERDREAADRSTGRKMIGVLLTCKAAADQAIRWNTIAVVTGEHGIGKTVSAQWIQEHHHGAVLITCDDKDCDENFIIDMLYDALRVPTQAPHRRNKKREVVAYLRSHRNVIVLVDEAQKLTRSALELLRSIHDQSDLEGTRRTPVVLFGDQDFYRLVVQAKGGKRKLLSPQITSRLYPVVSLDSVAGEYGNDGGRAVREVYTLDDIKRLFNEQRVRLPRPETLDWVRRLANVPGQGRLRQAVRLVEIAGDYAKGRTITMSDLKAVMVLFLGADESRLVQDQIDDQSYVPAATAAVG